MSNKEKTLFPFLFETKELGIRISLNDFEMYLTYVAESTIKVGFEKPHGFGGETPKMNWRTSIENRQK